MRIEVLTIRDLIPFIESELYKSFGELPITVLRAVSQANNPRADAGDPALLMALNDNNEVTSYIGFLPDTMTISGQTQKIFSNSCWWAKKDCTDNGAMQLFFAGCKLTKNQLFFPDLTPHTRQLLGNMKAFTVKEIDNGLCGYLNMDLTGILPAKKSFFSHLKLPLKVFDTIVNAIYIPVKRSWKHKTASINLTYEIVDKVDDETAEFISGKNKNELFQRNKDEINWILSYPWLTTKPTDTTKSYAFTCRVNSFKIIPVKVYNSVGLAAFFILLEHDGKMFIPYFYCNVDVKSDVLKLIYELLLENNADTFTSFQPVLNNVIRSQPHPFLHLRQRSKFIAYATNRDADFAAKNIQDGDGDCAFV